MNIINQADIVRPDAMRPYINADQLARARHVKTAFVAVSRDALAAALMKRYGLKNFQALTKAIRAGCGNDVDFDAINRAACCALFPGE